MHHLAVAPIIYQTPFRPGQHGPMHNSQFLSQYVMSLTFTQITILSLHNSAVVSKTHHSKSTVSKEYVL